MDSGQRDVSATEDEKPLNAQERRSSRMNAPPSPGEARERRVMSYSTCWKKGEHGRRRRKNGEREEGRRRVGDMSEH